MHRIVHIELEHWDVPQRNRERIECSSVQTIREALSRLDGDKTDSLSIEIPSAGALMIGGGPDQFIIVSFPADGSSSHVETDTAQIGSVELQVGGQTGFYSPAMILSFDLAFAIAEHFFREGEFDSSLGWVQDCPPE
ncbi:MAG: hypothetical protein ACK4UN_06375 [Limisphaerales bacterium]